MSTSPKTTHDPEYASSTTLVILAASVLHSLMWFAQSILCTSCELVPILAGTQGRVPRWCPQSRFKDTGQAGLATMLGTLATAKDFTQWVMVGLTLALLECARREYRRAERIRRDAHRDEGAGVDLGGPRQGGFKAPAAVGAVELSTISAPKLGAWNAEEQTWPPSAPPQKQRRSRREIVTKRRDDGPALPPLPTDLASRTTTQGAAPSRGQHTGLKRSGTLNYMYESRV